VYNLGGAVWPSQDPESDAYHFNSGLPGLNIARVASVNATSENNPIVTMASNPFASQASPQRSPSDRFQVVTGPVSYVCEPGANGRNQLVRYWGYEIDTVQTVPPKGSPQRAVIASNLAGCGQIFSHGSDATRRSGLVILALTLHAGRDNDSVIRLVSQVHVDNTP
jgi:MSHA biogenesis protein MshO